MPYTLGQVEETEATTVIPIPVPSVEPTRSAWTPEEKKVWSLISLASAAASAFHGYRRNQSIGWALGWFVLGGLFPVITPVIAVAQGFGKPKGAALPATAGWE